MAASSETFRVANDLAAVGRLVIAVEHFCRALKIAESDVAAFELAVEELATNVATHAYADGARHEFTVRLAFVDAHADGGEALRSVIEDDAPAFDPLSRAEVDTTLPLAARPIGGLGVHLVKKLMDRCAYERRDGLNVVTIERRLRTPREGV